MIFDPTKVKLGKGKAKMDAKRLFLAKYLKAELPAPPPEVNWAAGVPADGWGMLGNDTLGDCTIADIAHGLQVWMQNVGFAWDASVGQNEAIKYYEWWCGYNPADPSTDQGGVIIDELNNWQKSNFSGHKLVGYADPATTDANGNVTFDLDHVKQSIALFGGVSIGIQLPITAQGQDVWDVVGDPVNDPNSQPGSWGGHAVFCPAYDSGNLTCITWGAVHNMTWNFFTTYADEAHTLFGGMWVEKKQAPSSFDWAQFLVDLQAITG